MESVYSAVRTDSLYKADYVWSLKVKTAGVWGLVPIHGQKESGRLKTVCCRIQHKLLTNRDVLRLSGERGGGRRRRVEVMELDCDNASSSTATNVTGKPSSNVHNLYLHSTSLRSRQLSK